jgi:hypothetical protein
VVDVSVIYNGKTYYRTAEACRAAGISKNTYIRWVNQGTFSDVSARDARGWRLFTKEDVVALRAEAYRIGKPHLQVNDPVSHIATDVSSRGWP